MKNSNEVEVYKCGFCACSVCVPAEMEREDIEKMVNLKHPTGISSRWTISEDKKFRQGKSNPCECDKNPNRKHYLLEC